MTEPAEPRRLQDGDDPTSRLLADANARFSAALDESGAWRRLERRIERGGLARSRWPLIAATLAAAAAVALVLVRPRPEAVVGIEVARENATVVAEAPVPEPPSVTSTATVLTPKGAPQAVVPPARRSVDCSRPLASLEPRDAAVCLEARSVDAGLDAERALLELAALRRDRLQDAGGAVAALREHRARFPGGVLRGEVDFALVELLPRIGAVDEALAEAAALLEKPWGRARASELYLARGTLLQDRRDDCSRAVEELGKIQSEFGPVGDEAQYRYAQCLERLGDVEGARTALSAYLARSAPRHAASAQARLEALR